MRKADPSRLDEDQRDDWSRPWGANNQQITVVVKASAVSVPTPGDTAAAT